MSKASTPISTTPKSPQSDSSPLVVNHSLWKVLSLDAKKSQSKLQCAEIQKGVNQSFKKVLEVNLSNAVQCILFMTPLQTKIKEFFEWVDVTEACPDRKKTVKDPEDPSNKVAVRYRLATLKNLHDKFNAKSEYTGASETFTRNIPFNVQKPEPSAWGLYLCSICLNPELKLESLWTNKKEHFRWDEARDYNQTDHLIKNLSNLSLIKDNISFTEWPRSSYWWKHQ